MRTLLHALIGFGLLVAGGVGIAAFCYLNRPLPAPLRDVALFPGITYTRDIRREPVPQIWHIVRIDLTTPGLTFLTTPRDDLAGFPYRARTTSQFLSEYGLHVAINGDYFRPWKDHILSYYPHVGDGVAVGGYAVARGEVVTEGYSTTPEYRTLYITADNRASFTLPQAPVHTAISGKPMALIDGASPPIVHRWDVEYLLERNPRTIIALDATETTLLLVLVDGRQPNYSEGATLPEAAEVIRAYGGWNALNLDGGGSTALAMRDAAGEAVLLNSPVHGRIPGRERPVANHLGVAVR